MLCTVFCDFCFSHKMIHKNLFYFIKLFLIDIFNSFIALYGMNESLSRGCGFWCQPPIFLTLIHYLRVAFIEYLGFLFIYFIEYMGFLVAQRLKHLPVSACVCLRLPAMWETWVQFLGREDLLEKEMATHSSILAWRIPWTEEPGGLQSMGSQRVRHD